ncbi:unnamed protein product [marine sediment metagenome]|uniref:Ferredoxin-thioredoxin reductase subunit B n=1 Tax=marine sediment metagenome TaxID=412755 RepID=X1QK92_9ZZZZ
MEEGKKVEKSVGEAERIKKNILTFCKAHDFFVHPAKNLDDHVERVIEIGCCPCDPRRKECPCEQAVEEIEQGRGICCCSIICSEAYLREWHYIEEGMPLYLRKKRRPLTLFKEKAEK